MYIIYTNVHVCECFSKTQLIGNYVKQHFHILAESWCSFTLWRPVWCCGAAGRPCFFSLRCVLSIELNVVVLCSFVSRQQWRHHCKRPTRIRDTQLVLTRLIVGCLVDIRVHRRIHTFSFYHYFRFRCHFRFQPNFRFCWQRVVDYVCKSPPTGPSFGGHSSPTLLPEEVDRKPVAIWWKI